MNLIVSAIVQGVNEQNSIVNICVYADDWTAKSAIKASYASPRFSYLTNPESSACGLRYLGT